MLHENEKHFNKMTSSPALFKVGVYLFRGRNKWPRFKILSLEYLSKIITDPFLGVFQRHLCLCLNTPCFKKTKKTNQKNAKPS